MYRIDIGIDLGTANVKVYMRDKGIVITQPSVVAFERKSKTIVAVGSKAKRMYGKTPEGIEVVKPLKHGVISNYTLAERMVKAFVKNAMQKRRIWGRPNICVSVPSGVTEVERRAVEDAVCRIGAKEVFVLQSAVAAAIGAKIDIMETYGHMVVDIGAGTTDIAVLSSGGIAEGRSVKIAGDDYTEALIKYVRRKYNILLGELTAEEAKCEIGSVYKRRNELTYEVKGKNTLSGLPVKLVLTSEELREAFEEVTEQILNAIYMVIENSPPELIADVTREGIILTGGGSLIYGLDKLIEQKTSIKVVKVDEPFDTVCNGVGTSAEYITAQEELT